LNTTQFNAKAKKSQSPAQFERALKSEEAIRTMMPELRRQALADLALSKRKLEGESPSAAWVADCWASGEKFPPKADTTPMEGCNCDRCIRQGRRWPRFYHAPPALGGEPKSADPATDRVSKADFQLTSDFLSYECYLESLDDWTAAQLPSSPSGLALRAVREGRIKLRRQRTRLGRPQRAKVS
jgi:hypothetical protein